MPMQSAAVDPATTSVGYAGWWVSKHTGEAFYCDGTARAHSHVWFPSITYMIPNYFVGAILFIKNARKGPITERGRLHLEQQPVTKS